MRNICQQAADHGAEDGTAPGFVNTSQACASVKDGHHAAVAGPYNKIQNWDYVKLIESMDNGNDQSWAVRVGCRRRAGL